MCYQYGILECMKESNPKELALTVLAAGIPVITFWMWFKTIPLLTEGEYRDFIRFIIPVIGLAVSGALFTLLGIFVRKKILAYASALFGIAFPFFFLTATPTVLGSLGVSLILIAYAVYRMREEFDYSLGFSVAKVARAGLPVYFSVASILVAMFYLSGLSEERALSAFVPRSLIQFFLDRMSGDSGFFSNLPPVRADTTVDELIRQMARRELEAQGLTLSSIPERELSRLIALQRDNLSTQFDIELTGKEKVGEAFYVAITEKIEDFFGSYRYLLPAAAAIAFFLAFKAFTWPLYFAAMLLAYILIKILILATIVKKETVTIEVQKLVF